MFKRIISIILAVLLVQSTIVVFASEGTVYVNEVFDDYPLNSIPAGIKMSGVDARVAGNAGGNKFLYSKMWGSGAAIKIPLPALGDKIVISFDIMLKGDDYSGSILNINNTASLLKISDNGLVTLEDGYEAGSLISGKWSHYDVYIDYVNKCYDLYIGGKKKVEKRYFSQGISKPGDISFTFNVSGSDSIGEIFVDNVRAYQSTYPLEEKKFPKKTPSTEVRDFTPATEKKDDNVIYIDSYGRSGLSGGAVKFIQKDGSSTGWGQMNEKEPECIHFNQVSTYDSWAEVTTGITEEVPNFIFQADIYIVNLSTGSATLARTYDASRRYSTLLTLSSNGSVVVNNAETVGTIPFGQWTNYAVAVDYISGNADVYINGRLVKENASPLDGGGIIPTMVELKINTAPAEGHNEMYINNIKAYSGTKLREFEPQNIQSNVSENKEGIYKTTQESEADAKKKLGSDSVFMTGCNYYFANGEKKTYSSHEGAYKTSSAPAMVSLQLVSDTLGVKLENKDDGLYVNGKKTNISTEEKNSLVYVDIASLAGEVLSKYVYADPRGMVLVSDTDRGYSNSINSMNTLEDSDFLYRYMQFERPDGDRIYEDIKNTSYKEHPRMFIRKSEIPALREKIQSSEMLKNELSDLLVKCENYLDADPVKYEIPDGLRLFSSCYTVKTRLIDLGVAYLITGDNKYRERMWVEVQNALSWKDWNLENHFLDSGEIGPGIAFAYDILYDYLTEEERQYYRDRVEELYLDFAVGVYTGESSFAAMDGRMTRTNWGAVIANSMLMCALAFIDDEPADSEFTEKCKFIAQCALQSHEFSFEIPFPDGDISEGIAYWSYFVESLGWTLKTLENMCGSDYGCLDSPGYPVMAEFELYVQTANGVYAHCDTAYDDPNVPIVPETYLISQFYGNDRQMEVLDVFRRNMGRGLGARGLLWYQLPEGDVDPDSYSLDKRFSQSLTVMRSNWGNESSYLGVSCGTIHSESHLDKGSFLYENRGERWFVDIGKDDYNIPGYHGDAAYTIYRKRAEGHNTLVINPVVDVPEQIPYSNPQVIKFEAKPKGAITICDLTEAYANEVKYYKRGFLMSEDRNTLVVQDELEFKKPSNEFYHFLHTEGNITILPDGKSAVVEQNGKTLRVEVICDAPEWKLERRDTSPLFEATNKDGEYSRDAFSKLTIVGKASGKLNISVKMIPVDGRTYLDHTLVPMDQWTIPDGEIVESATLDYIKMNGRVIDNFMPTTVKYTVDINYGDSILIEAASSDATVEIQQAKDISDTAKITVKAADGFTRVYEVNFNVVVTVTDKSIYGTTQVGLPEGAKFLDIHSVNASHIPQPENTPENVTDGNFKTRWSADASGAYIELDLGQAKDISGVAIAFMDGSLRFSKYEILVSEDNFNYTRIFNGKSTGQTEEYEYLNAPVRARYVRLIGFGNTENEWNSVTEFRPYTIS